MNKTVSINLGGLVFHIDEDAFQKLSHYFDAIKRSLSNTKGQEEIINDIEMRVGELVVEKHKSDKQVISIKQVDEIISIMGQPEDYRIDDEEPKNTTSNFETLKRDKKLFRDKDEAVIGGVLAGLGHYFGIDKVFLRILFLVLFFVAGTGFLAYIILWIAMPEAQTTSEKLEMRGKPVTISNIEKKVREEFGTLSEKIKSTDFEKMKSEMKSNSEKFNANFKGYLDVFFNVIAKTIGALMILGSLAILVIFLIGVLAFGTTNFESFPFHSFIELGNFTDYPVWFFGLLFYIAVSIPSIFISDPCKCFLI